MSEELDQTIADGATAAVTANRKPPAPVEVMELQAGSFKDAYKTRCQGCPSMLMVALPMVHCPACHNIWRARKLTSPSRCSRCNFSLWQWRKLNRIADNSNAAALLQA